MLIKKETEYATFGLMALARYKNSFVDIRVIAKNEKIPADHLSKIFQRLNRAKLVESKTGPSGGFRLRKDPKHISLVDIMQAVQNKNVIRCYAGNSDHCRHPHCKFKKVVVGLEKNIDRYLTKILLSDLINKY